MRTDRTRGQEQTTDVARAFPIGAGGFVPLLSGRDEDGSRLRRGDLRSNGRYTREISDRRINGRYTREIGVLVDGTRLLAPSLQ